ncbi:MAG: tryptophan synthase subunit alpha [Pseudomonadales bacterium]|nr:tryptophan synthase subunit alpha [Pseudomonadales bacterium]
MSRIENRFKKLSSQNKKALIPYIVAGDPINSLTVKVMQEMVAKGADIIELGVPFSDPEAEGPVIQLAHERALKNNTSLKDTIAMVAEFRQTDNETPVLLMGYLNPIEKMGFEIFASQASAAGVDAVLIVNLPPEEDTLLEQSLTAHKMDSIYLLAPTTTDERAAFLGKQARGFIYYVSLKGTTGASSIKMDEVEIRVNGLRQFTQIPMVVGFGIKNGSNAARVCGFADGAVVGTAIVDIFQAFQTEPDEIIQRVGHLIEEMRQAMDAARKITPLSE